MAFGNAGNVGHAVVGYAVIGSGTFPLTVTSSVGPMATVTSLSTVGVAGSSAVVGTAIVGRAPLGASGIYPVTVTSS